MEISMMWRCNEKNYARADSHHEPQRDRFNSTKYTKWVILHKIGVISQSSHLTKWLVLKPVYDDGYPNSLFKKTRWIQMPALEIPLMSRSEAGCLVASSTLRCKSLWGYSLLLEYYIYIYSIYIHYCIYMETMRLLLYNTVIYIIYVHSFEVLQVKT